MLFFRSTILLFTLNVFDAVLTLFWVRNGFATEGNALMAQLLDIGDFTFLAVKIGIGTIAALVLWRWGNLSLARYGLVLALTIYIGLMGVHFVTGLSACGLISENFFSDAENWTNTVLAFHF